MRVLVVNAGSSSLKLALLQDRRVLASQQLPLRHGRLDQAQLEQALRGPLAQADVIGHRIVHGGTRYTAPVRIDGDVQARLWQLADLAPLHQAKSLQALAAVGAILPGLPAIACFDTAFHADLPQPAATYALPAAWRQRWALRRYGFHGLSHAWVAARAPAILRLHAADPVGAAEPKACAPRSAPALPPRRPPLRIVSCHLGAGASLCAIEGMRSVDTTMGFTPLEGLPMATRSGSVDPGLLLWLIERTGLRERELAQALEHESGLLGLAGSSDMKQIVEQAQQGRPEASLALGVFIHRLRAGVAAMAAALGGLDVLAFTGGVGEASAEVRRLAAEGLRFLGVQIDSRRNDAVSSAGGTSGPARSLAGPADAQPLPHSELDREITAPSATVRTVVLKAREDLEIAAQVESVLLGSNPAA